MEIYTIGFTKRSASEFFGALEAAQVRRVVDVRLNNRSQLAGFTKASDLPYFLDRILDASYEHEPLLAPESDMLKAYRAGDMSWTDYGRRYNELLESRRVGAALEKHAYLNRSALLCSELEPHRCHRRLAAEYLRSRWGESEIEIIHV